MWEGVRREEKVGDRGGIGEPTRHTQQLFGTKHLGKIRVRGRGRVRVRVRVRVGVGVVTSGGLGEAARHARELLRTEHLAVI